MIERSYRFTLSLTITWEQATFVVDATSIDEAYKAIYAIQLQYADEYALGVAVSPAWGCYENGRLVAGQHIPLDDEWTWADTYALSAVLA